jgi:hypothetical protein
VASDRFSVGSERANTTPRPYECGRVYDERYFDGPLRPVRNPCNNDVTVLPAIDITVANRWRPL